MEDRLRTLEEKIKFAFLSEVGSKDIEDLYHVEFRVFETISAGRPSVTCSGFISSHKLKQYTGEPEKELFSGSKRYPNIEIAEKNSIFDVGVVFGARIRSSNQELGFTCGN